MGMFDRVWVDCPKCGQEVEFQSKAGECVLMDYTLETAPPNVQVDLIGDNSQCNKCGHVVGIRFAPRPPLVVAT